jgi:hypothetical protein
MIRAAYVDSLLNLHAALGRYIFPQYDPSASQRDAGGHPDRSRPPDQVRLL